MSRILIIEDNDVTAKFLGSMLRDKGFEVRVLNLGQEIVRQAKDFKPHLILMDILLPDIDGAEAVRMLQRDVEIADIPVIFLSSIVEQDPEKAIKGITVNEKEYPALSKSIPTQQLLDVIKGILKKTE